MNEALREENSKLKVSFSNYKSRNAETFLELFRDLNQVDSSLSQSNIYKRQSQLFERAPIRTSHSLGLDQFDTISNLSSQTKLSRSSLHLSDSMYDSGIALSRSDLSHSVSDIREQPDLSRYGSFTQLADSLHHNESNPPPQFVAKVTELKHRLHFLLETNNFGKVQSTSRTRKTRGRVFSVLSRASNRSRQAH